MKEKCRPKHLAVILVLVMCCGVIRISAAAQGALNEKVSLQMEKASIHDVFRKLEAQTGLTFLYKNDLFSKVRTVNVHATDLEVEKVLNNLLKPYGLTYELDDNVVIIKTEQQRPVTSSTIQTPKVVVKGKVVNADNSQPIAGASVIIKSTSQSTPNATGTITNENGEFTLTLPRIDEPLTISYVGFAKLDYAFPTTTSPGTALVIRLKPEVQLVDKVIILGTVERKKESFTGTTKVVTAEELKSVGNMNIIQSLKTLDPSFNVISNDAANLAGSNPNVMPTIEMRGQTSISIQDAQNVFGINPNQPLFIMDGFETTLQAIIDLPMDRVASITLLKDAASTAMYGSRAANGVVVVNTVRPKGGKLRFTYTSDLTFQWPDLNSYNMMNAAENLEFERRSGRYTFYSATYYKPNDPNDHRLNPGDYRKQLYLDSLYSLRLNDVLSGVNSYWMSEPLRNAFSNKNAIRITGGGENLIVDAAISFRNQPGVMKGSVRNTWGGNIDLMYTTGNFSFYNKLNLSGYQGKESKYGSFDTWVNTNPYYRKYNEDGTIPRYLDEKISNSYDTGTKVANPLYNAMLNSRDDMNNLTMGNNFQVIWKFRPDMQLQGALGLKKEGTTYIQFTPPENTQFDNTDALKKGSYLQRQNNFFSYDASLMYVWNKQIKRHSFTLNARGEIQSIKRDQFTTEAEGYPGGTNDSPIFAYSYKTNTKPGYTISELRRFNFLGTGSYAFDNRYLLDFTYRLDGSTAFGSAKKYSPFWAVGLGWNIYNERFMENLKWIDILSIKGNIGTSGNQNIGGFTSTSIYDYISGRHNHFGTGMNFSSLGNPNIRWQNTLQTSLSFNMSVLKNRAQIEFNVYEKNSNPLIVNIDVAPSDGVTSYPMSLGHLITRGMEFDVTYNIINDQVNRIQWGIRGFGEIVRSKFSGMSDQLSGMNKAQQENKTLIRYMDGYSQEDLWAVPSLGIDPATGKEIFLTKEGTATYLYNTDDIVKVGNSRPDITGVIGTNFRYKNIYFSCNLRYSVGGDKLNSALYNKVENISIENVTKNQDRRALYNRWYQPGDMAQFKGISLTSTTPMSSRFIQKNNYFSGESLSVGYQFNKDGWIKHLGLESLRVQGYMNDFFLASTIKAERGIYYPFTRSISMNLTAMF